MRRLLDVADWPWTDHDPNHGRLALFLRSGEVLTTLFLMASAYALILPNSTFAQSTAFTWIRAASHFGPAGWAIAAVALSITGPLALVMDNGFLRVLSVFSQGVYFVIFGIAFRARSPTGIAWAIFLISGLWLLARSGLLVRHHWRWRANHERRAG